MSEGDVQSVAAEGGRKGGRERGGSKPGQMWGKERGELVFTC